MALLIASLVTLHCSDQIMYYEPEYYALLESSNDENSSIEESSEESSPSSEDDESRPKRITQNSSSEEEESSLESSSRKKSGHSSSSGDEKKRSSSSEESSTYYSCEPDRSSEDQVSSSSNKYSSESSDMSKHTTVITYAGYSSGQFVSESDSLYDANGKLIQWTHREPMEAYVEGTLNEHLDTTRYTYNSQNLLTGQKTYRNGEVAYRSQFTYNGDKRLIYKVNYTGASQWVSSESYKYDTNGKLLEQKTTFKEGETESHEYRYYSDHIEQDYFRGETLTLCYTDILDSIDRVVEHYIGCEESKRELVKTYAYNDNGEVSVLEEYSDRDGDGERSLYSRKEYSYDQGVISFINTIIEDEPNADHTETFTYDDEGRIVQYHHELATGWISGYQWFYHDTE
ncbi:MAG: hypothetical protein OCD76_05020 [Reichenbachiella sp.]